MKAIVQRVNNAEVIINKKEVASIKRGFLVFVAFKKGDSEEKIQELANKILNLRIMADEHDKINLSLKDVAGEILVVPEFTLYADTSQRRPYFGQALESDIAKEYFEKFIALLNESGLKIASGVFGAMMKVYLENDGPATIILEN